MIYTLQFRIIGNVTCKQEHTSSESQQQTCSGEWGCRPVKQFVCFNIFPTKYSTNNFYINDNKG